MSFNIFGPATKKDIRVGYISPDTGYVSNVSILEANKYAALNPGTIFILDNRNSTRYLTINEVNALTVDEALNVDGNVCDGIRGLRPGERAPFSNRNGSGTGTETGGTGSSSYDNGCRSEFYISGGGGVGALGSPIFGRDGSLLAVRVVKGGFGYKYPPKATLIDSCRRGSGAVIRTVIGELPPTTEYFDQEEDFEIYDLTPDGTELSGYGLRYGVDGEVLGEWDPNLFATLVADPIGGEIQKYQDFLRQGINPFWHTRKENPISVTFRDKTTRVLNQVSHHAWDTNENAKVIDDSFMNRYAVSPVPASNVPGSDYAGRWATMEWEEDFPYTGEYVFRGMADNVSKIYLDNQLITEPRNFRGDPLPQNIVKKTIQEGVHRIKIDLFNIPIKEKVKVKGDPTNIKFNVTTSADFANGINIPALGVNISKQYKGKQLKESFSRDIQYGVEYDVITTSGGRGKIKLRTSGQNVLQMEESTDNDWQDLVCTVSGGRFIKINGNKCKLIFDAPPKTQTGSNQKSVSGTIFTTTDYINGADRKLWRTNVYGRGGFLNEYGVCPFDTRKPLDGNPYAGTHVIRWNDIDFPADGNYNITVDVDDYAKISIDNGKGDEVIVENGMKKTTHTKFFKKGKYKIKADLLQIPGGRFSFDGGTGQPSRADISARFINRDGKNYLKVDGSGTAEISFRLRVDDNPRISGVFAEKVKIGLPPNDYVLLSRSRSGGGYKEKEVITGSDVFEAGREYLVDAIGSSRGTGSVIKNNGNTIEYDDDIDNGFDENADLSITKVKNLQSSSVKGVNPMALAIKIEVGEVEVTRISPKTWNENPMGAALTIDAPLPPIPQSPIPIGEGRCPRNPIWTTRFPGGQKKWWPVNHPAWSKFTNRFALSPLPPLSTLNSDGGGGIIYDNTWTLDIPYDGFYGVKGTADNAGRILIDGREVYKLKGFKNKSPKIEKVKLTEGSHTIKVEVENFRQENTKVIKEKIFSTQDWAKRPSPGGSVDVDFRITSSAKFANTVEMKEVFSFGKSYDGPQIKESISKTLESGKIYDVIFNSNRKGGSGNNSAIKLRNAGQNVVQMEDHTDNDWQDIVVTASKGKFYDFRGNRCKYDVGGGTKAVQVSPTQNGVTYSGPEVFRYLDTRKNVWSDFMNKNNVSPFLPPLNSDNPNIVGVRTFTWSNVNFPESGRYDALFQSDDTAKLFINGQKVAESRSFSGEPNKIFFELSAGKYELKVELENIQLPENIFSNYNPTGFALKIFKDIRKVISTPPWTTNPLCASAILIPPPCPKVVKGTGVVTEIIPEEPGNSYPAPPASGPPVTLVLKEIIPTSPGINYGPDDVILINGTPLQPILGPFGTVDGVVPKPLYGFTDYPNITMPSDTGVGFRGRPVFEPVIVPELVIPEDQLLQVTDLVGLKQTGYVNGKPYYGSTFSQDGILYAGIYETTGDLIQVYATLQESVDNQVTTRASAILRQGSDVTSNDPRLNIPNTPDNLV
jgi:hypothetical protein